MALVTEVLEGYWTIIHMVTDMHAEACTLSQVLNERGMVEAAGYDGFCEVEIFSKENWWRRPPEEVLATCIARYRTVC